MHDNKLRLSPDVITKAEEIAETWGLKNARAAIEAVFRKYADDYQYGRQPMMEMLAQFQGVQGMQMMTPAAVMPLPQSATMPTPQPTTPGIGAVHPPAPQAAADTPACDALNELDNLIGL